MVKFKHMHNNQRGAMSFLTVIFLAIILTVVTISFVRISTNEQRQAVDDDLTTRAFYAAESGIEDGKRAIAHFINNPSTYDLSDLNGDDCDPARYLDGDLDIGNLSTEYTCQFIDLTPGSFDKSLAPWESVTIPLISENGDSFDRVRISWHETEQDGAITPRNTGDDETLVEDDWLDADHAAMLRTMYFATPAGTFNADAINGVVGFLNPTNGGGSQSVGPGFDGNVVNANCDPNDTPSCVMTLTGLSGDERYLRIQALYRGTQLTVELLNGSTVVDFEDVQAEIDVTGRAGDVYRRISARVSLLPPDFPLPDVAIWSNTEICKDFSVTDDAGDFPGLAASSSCEWLDP